MNESTKIDKSELTKLQQNIIFLAHSAMPKECLQKKGKQLVLCKDQLTYLLEIMYQPTKLSVKEVCQLCRCPNCLARSSSPSDYIT